MVVYILTAGGNSCSQNLWVYPPVDPQAFFLFPFGRLSPPVDPQAFFLFPFGLMISD
jgi:hypothetical protein